uniref:Uncharacterized protein n=1 Tax=Oryza sativa subsp. japonica TaxID=39947 RepID=Q5W6L8_ORYSJ|nr:hypothetical protein [Oryza sativa Japonica Group]
MPRPTQSNPHSSSAAPPFPVKGVFTYEQLTAAMGNFAEPSETSLLRPQRAPLPGRVPHPPQGLPHFADFCPRAASIAFPALGPLYPLRWLFLRRPRIRDNPKHGGGREAQDRGHAMPLPYPAGRQPRRSLLHVVFPSIPAALLIGSQWREELTGLPERRGREDPQLLEEPPELSLLPSPTLPLVIVVGDRSRRGHGAAVPIDPLSPQRNTAAFLFAHITNLGQCQQLGMPTASSMASMVREEGRGSRR